MFYGYQSICTNWIVLYIFSRLIMFFYQVLTTGRCTKIVISVSHDFVKKHKIGQMFVLFIQKSQCCCQAVSDLTLKNEGKFRSIESLNALNVWT